METIKLGMYKGQDIDWIKVLEHDNQLLLISKDVLYTSIIHQDSIDSIEEADAYSQLYDLYDILFTEFEKECLISRPSLPTLSMLHFMEDDMLISMYHDLPCSYALSKLEGNDKIVYLDETGNIQSDYLFKGYGIRPVIRINLKKYKNIISSSCFEDYYNKGYDAMMLGQYEKAISYFKECERLYPKATFEPIYILVGYCFEMLEKYDVALKFYKQEFAYNNSSLESLFMIGNLSIKMKNYDLAIACFNKLIEENYEYNSVCKRLAYVYRILNDYKKEYTYSTLRFEKYYHKANAYISSALYAIRSNDINVAIDYYKAALKSEGVHKESIYCKIGDLYRKIGKEIEAKIEYENALNINPRYTHANYQLALLHSKREEYNEALLYFEILLELKQLEDIAYNNIGMIYYYKGELLKAIRYFKNAININDQYANGYRNIASIYHKLGDDHKANEYLKLGRKNGAL